MGFSGYIAACKTEAMRQDALSKLNTAAVRADKAVAAGLNGHVDDAFEWWRLLYGSNFPTYYY